MGSQSLSMSVSRLHGQARSSLACFLWRITSVEKAGLIQSYGPTVPHTVKLRTSFMRVEAIGVEAMAIRFYEEQQHVMSLATSRCL